MFALAHKDVSLMKMFVRVSPSRPSFIYRAPKEIEPLYPSLDFLRIDRTRLYERPDAPVIEFGH
jgi:hypothetical protein